ncbi:MAG: serine/threonine protein kinase [Myxococcota bacterium]|nr:serine/threonine protein kinase [Myxococcota bacterium]
MSRTQTPTNKPQTSRTHASVELTASDGAVLVQLAGFVDEKFAGFGEVGDVRAIVLDVSGMTRMTSFGVRQWIKALDALPKAADVYLFGCPTFLVDQLNMVLSFGGPCKVLTVAAPFTCTSCGVESSEVIDVCSERATLLQGTIAPRVCRRCGQALELDESPESYFAFARRYGATMVNSAAAQLLAAHGLYTTLIASETEPDKPPKIIKLVHGTVTYYRIIGSINGLFRARQFLIGAEGEIVLDLAEVERFEPSGLSEWKRLLKGLATQVPSVTLVDVNQSYLSNAGDTLLIARNIIVASLLVARRCGECARISNDSTNLANVTVPMSFRPGVCSRCGGTTESLMKLDTLAPLQKASTVPLKASADIVARRDELMSRAMTDANVAQAGDNATAAVSADDTILGKYKILQRLSVGGMAEVFLANQIGIGGFEKPVALKRIQRKLLDSRHMAIDMFLNEAKIASRLTHPNIVQVLDVGEAGGALYLAMEYVHGKDLRGVTKRLKQNGDALLPLGDTLHIIREVAQALHYAYWSTDMSGQRLSVVHRDISPHNIILGYDGSVKLLDFGVAMSSVTEHAESIVVGKWHYMAPEATTNGKVDHRSDLFSLGVILYLLVSGQMPFTDREPKAILKKIRAGVYTKLDEVAVVPEALATLVHRMMAARPEDRPATGQDVAAQLADIARASGVDSSNTRIAELLTDLFPDEAASSYEDVALEIQIEPSSKSPASFARSSAARYSDGPIDVSVALGSKRGSQTFTPVGSPTLSASMAIPRHPTAQPSAKLPELDTGNPLRKVLLVLLLMAAIAAAAYYFLPNY